MTEIHGTCDDRFVAVRDQFAKHFADGLEVGASVAVTLGGVPQVDLWAGDAIDGQAPWVEDTIVNVYSTTKTMAALSVLVCADRGLLDVEAPVADYWPEFAANGKAAITVSQVMAHSSGVAGFDPPVTPADLYDWHGITAHLAAQAPFWEPGTAVGYHAVTQGYLQGELVRRVTGRSIGTFFAEEIAGPLDADFHIGLPASEDHRVGELVPPPDGPLGEAAAELDPTSVIAKVMLSVPLDATEPRTREWRGAEIPAAGGTGNARSVSRVHSAIACGGEVDGVRLLSPATIDDALTERSVGDDVVMAIPARFGLGFGIRSDMMPLPNDRILYWGGWGGSVAIIDVENQLTISYVMNKMGSALMGDTRGVDLVTAAYLSLFA